MPTASLQKMSVYTGGLPGSDQSLGNQTLLMPKLKYRFRVWFQGMGTYGPNETLELTRQVMDFTRPQVQFENIDLPVYNSTVKIAGKYTWQDITCQVRDDAGGNISRVIGSQLQKQLDFAEMSSASAGINYKFQTTFQVLDGGNGTNTPIALETWEMYGCYLQTVNYNESNYGTNEPMTVTMTIRFDNASQIETTEKPGTATGISTPG
jgi:hypothetical protein